MNPDELVISLVSPFIANVVEGVLSALPDLSARARNYFKAGIARYLRKNAAKCARIKTFLHRAVPEFIEDVYFPLVIATDTIRKDTYNVTTFFKGSGSIAITGDPGSGKSMMVKYLFYACIKQRYKIPILLELRRFNRMRSETSLLKYIKKELGQLGLADTEKETERLLQRGFFVIFIDGFDELRLGRREVIAAAIDRFVSVYDQNNYVLTSRPYSGIELLSRFMNFTIEPLTTREIRKFVYKEIKDRDYAAQIVRSLDSARSRYISEYLSNPLLLSLYIIAYRNNSEIPPKRHIFYQRVFDVLYKEHDTVVKLGYQRERRTGLDEDDFVKILKSFSLLTYYRSEFSFDSLRVTEIITAIRRKTSNVSRTFSTSDLIEDLRTGIGIWIEDGGRYSFVHRSLQEYFAALCTMGLSQNVKRKAYDSIIQSRNKKSPSELLNFLSLCEEMDAIPFYLDFLIPKLDYVLLHIDKRTERSKTISLLKFLFREVRITVDMSEYSAGQRFAKVEYRLMRQNAAVLATLRADPSVLASALDIAANDRHGPFVANLKARSSKFTAAGKVEIIKVVSVRLDTGTTTDKEMINPLLCSPSLVKVANGMIDQLEQSAERHKSIVANTLRCDDLLVGLLAEKNSSI